VSGGRGACERDHRIRACGAAAPPITNLPSPSKGGQKYVHEGGSVLMVVKGTRLGIDV